jgi:hypothetical protein
MAKKDDKTQDCCPNCGFCPHCGQSARPQVVPMPYPVPRPWPYVKPYVGEGPYPYRITWGAGGSNQTQGISALRSQTIC